jgi:hypothetical protein
MLLTRVQKNCLTKREVRSQLAWSWTAPLGCSSIAVVLTAYNLNLNFAVGFQLKCSSCV